MSLRDTTGLNIDYISGWPAGMSGGTAQDAAPPTGYGQDPFAYTGGSLLTPWTKQFVPPPGSGGGYSAPEYQPFNFGAFSAGAGYHPGVVTLNDITAERVKGETVARPDQIMSPAALMALGFKAPTQAEAEADAGYQFARNQGERALGNKFAASGLRGAGQAQAFSDYNQQAAAQQYGNVYNRRFGEYTTANQMQAQAYDLTNRYQQAAAMANQSANLQAGMTNAQLAQQANLANQAASLSAAQSSEQNRLGAYQANTQAGLGAANLNYQMRQGEYDRNLALAQFNYGNEQQARNAAASAGAANSNQAYSRALQQYQMEHDIFQENQGNQFSRLMAMAQLGNPGMVNPMQYAGAMGDIYGQGANAQAAGRVASGNAWQQAMGGMAQGALGAAGAYAGYQQPAARNPYRWYPGDEGGG